MNSKTIKVLMVIGSLGDGGKERQLLLLLKTLIQNQKIETFLISMNAGGEREDEAQRYADHFVALKGKRGVNLLMPIRQLVRLIKQHKIDVIHTWGSGVWDLTGLIAGHHCHVPVVHNGIRSAPNHLNIYNQITRFGAYFADHAVANSFAGLESFKLLKRPQASVIHNGLDLTRFEGVDKVEKGQNICMVANFREAKDHKTAINAFANVNDQFPNAKLRLVGHDYGTLSACQEQARVLGLENHIEFITNCNQPEPIIGECQIGLLTTNADVHGEGISNALLECMALGRPVVASINGGNAEVVTDNENGFLVEPGKPELISEKLIDLLSNPEKARTMGKLAEMSVKENFSVQRMVKEYTNLYQKLGSK